MKVISSIVMSMILCPTISLSKSTLDTDIIYKIDVKDVANIGPGPDFTTFRFIGLYGFGYAECMIDTDLNGTSFTYEVSKWGFVRKVTLEHDIIDKKFDKECREKLRWQRLKSFEKPYKIKITLKWKKYKSAKKKYNGSISR